MRQRSCAGMEYYGHGAQRYGYVMCKVEMHRRNVADMGQVLGMEGEWMYQIN